MAAVAQLLQAPGIGGRRITLGNLFGQPSGFLAAAESDVTLSLRKTPDVLYLTTRYGSLRRTYLSIHKYRSRPNWWPKYRSRKGKPRRKAAFTMGC
jgi:hypothetical protein